MNEFFPELVHLVPCETNIDINKLGDGGQITSDTCNGAQNMQRCSEDTTNPNGDDCWLLRLWLHASPAQCVVLGYGEEAYCVSQHEKKATYKYLSRSSNMPCLKMDDNIRSKILQIIWSGLSKKRGNDTLLFPVSHQWMFQKEWIYQCWVLR
jgi:hypothetical protein